MAQTVASYCRLCSGLCGVHVQLDPRGPSALTGDGVNPKNAGYTCAEGVESLALPGAADRLTKPLKREAGGLVPVSWEEALQQAGAALGALRRKHGPRALGVYAGAPLAHNHRGAIRAAALAIGAGTPNLFSSLAVHGAPLLLATELVVGAAVPLISDVGRAHYTILLGSEPNDHRWGPLQAGTVHTEALAHYRRNRGTKLIAAGPVATSSARDADLHVQLNPGTEVFFLLALCRQILVKGWGDHQFLRDYASNLDRAEAWLEPWTLDRCAGICGVEADVIGGIALKFSRAAMGTVTASNALTLGPHPTVASWAWLVLHALTANLLRPGGAYEAKGVLDLQPLLASVPSSQAPTLRVSGRRALLLQQPGTALAEEITTAGDERLRGLICVAADPSSHLPQPRRVLQALEGLDCLVAVELRPSPITEIADFVLPAPSFWEREDLHLLDQPMLPARFIQGTGAVAAPPGEARSEDHILSELFGHLAPPLRGGTWGAHLQLIARYAAGADLDPWIERGLDLAGLPPLDELMGAAGGIDRGESDRSIWRPLHPDGRLDLAPEALTASIQALAPPATTPEFPLLLTALQPVDGVRGWFRGSSAEPQGVRVHPDAGFADGARVVIESRAGRVEGTCRHDDEVAPGAVSIPWDGELPVGELISDTALDALSGAPALTGVPVRVTPG